MFGGADGGFCCPFRPARSDMWQFGPAGGWTRIPGQIPIELDRRGGQSLGQPVYDPVTGKTWVHSNTPNGSQIWTYDPRTAEWNLPTTNPGLPGTISQSMVAFDSHSRQLIIFGGVLGAETGSDQTWSFDIEGGVFEQKNPPVNPPARSDAAMVYDVASDRVILVGGYGPSSVLDDTWAYDVDNDSWTEMLPSPAVPPIAEVAAAYEPSGQRIVLFGGTGPEEGRGELAETWTYVFNENAWIQLQPSGTPVRRTLAALAYDAETAVIILFGGGSTGTNSGIPSELLRDTWLYDPAASTWTEWRSP